MVESLGTSLIRNSLLSIGCDKYSFPRRREQQPKVICFQRRERRSHFVSTRAVRSCFYTMLLCLQYIIRAMECFNGIFYILSSKIRQFAHCNSPQVLIVKNCIRYKKVDLRLEVNHNWLIICLISLKK